jgi:Tol biopolymer transport system component
MDAITKHVESQNSYISSDGLYFFFYSNRPGGAGESDIWLSTRATKEDDWSTAVNLGSAINSKEFDGYPSISPDGSTLYFSSNRPGVVGDFDLWKVSIDVEETTIVDIWSLY